MKIQYKFDFVLLLGLENDQLKANSQCNCETQDQTPTLGSSLVMKIIKSCQLFIIN